MIGMACGGCDTMSFCLPEYGLGQPLCPPGSLLEMDSAGLHSRPVCSEALGSEAC